ncbi:MAG TPA: hypothetical protein VFJ97_08430 [Dermatophilaceae bacterium]|nr:hypothetical protein [Dermatophilaceae bacterium]
MNQSPAASPAEQLRSSARGWHGVQLGVLGFIGLCGVLKGAGGADMPGWLELLAGVLVLVSLALACVATALVAAVAWPVRVLDEARVDPAQRRLRFGIGLTYVAVVVLALAATSSWWPHQARPSLVQVSTQGGTFCGELSASSEDGAVTLRIGGQAVALATSQIRGLQPVQSC